MKISELKEEDRLKAIEYQKLYPNDENRSGLDSIKSFIWNSTNEGSVYWQLLNQAIFIDNDKPDHYDNSKGSLYKFCEDQKLNAYEFDILKRVMRCRKKGNFIEDLKKTKFLIDLYIQEYEK